MEAHLETLGSGNGEKEMDRRGVKEIDPPGLAEGKGEIYKLSHLQGSIVYPWCFLQDHQIFCLPIFQDFLIQSYQLVSGECLNSDPWLPNQVGRSFFYRIFRVP